MNKVLFSDIDGTLVRDDKTLSPELIKACNDFIDRGNEIVLVTGRSPGENLKYITDKIKIKYIIGNNGATIREVQGKVYYEDTIDSNVCNILKEYAETNNLNILFNTNYESSNKYKNKINQIIIMGSSKKYENVLNYINSFTEKNSGYSIIPINYANRKEQNKFFFDIVNNYINKGASINKFIDIFKIDKDNCYAIGNGINDLSMKDNVAFIALENSIEELKDGAIFQVKSNNEDGIIEALERIENGR